MEINRIAQTHSSIHFALVAQQLNCSAKEAKQYLYEFSQDNKKWNVVYVVSGVLNDEHVVQVGTKFDDFSIIYSKSVYSISKGNANCEAYNDDIPDCALPYEIIATEPTKKRKVVAIDEPSKKTRVESISEEPVKPKLAVPKNTEPIVIDTPPQEKKKTEKKPAQQSLLSFFKK